MGTPCRILAGAAALLLAGSGAAAPEPGKAPSRRPQADSGKALEERILGADLVVVGTIEMTDFKESRTARDGRIRAGGRILIHEILWWEEEKPGESVPLPLREWPAECWLNEEGKPRAGERIWTLRYRSDRDGRKGISIEDPDAPLPLARREEVEGILRRSLCEEGKEPKAEPRRRILRLSSEAVFTPSSSLGAAKGSARDAFVADLFTDGSWSIQSERDGKTLHKKGELKPSEKEILLRWVRKYRDFTLRVGKTAGGGGKDKGEASSGWGEVSLSFHGEGKVNPGDDDREQIRERVRRLVITWRGY